MLQALFLLPVLLPLTIWNLFATPAVHSGVGATVGGYVTLQGHRFVLPDGPWQVFGEEIVASRGPSGLVLVQVSDRGTITALTLRDYGAYSSGAGPTGLTTACDARDALDVVEHLPAPAGSDLDCVRVSVVVPNGDPLEPVFLQGLAQRGLRRPPVQLAVTLAVQTATRRFYAQLAQDAVDAGFTGQPVDGWSRSAVDRDEAKRAYVARLAAWGEKWRTTLLAEATEPSMSPP